MLCFFFMVHKIKYISLSSWLSHIHTLTGLMFITIHPFGSVRKITERWGWLWQFLTTALLWWELVLVLFSVWEVEIPTDFRWSMEGFQSFLEIQENWGWASVWCCLIWRTSDSWSWLRCRTIYCKTVNHSISSQTVTAKRQRWHQRCHLWGVLKKSPDWHTRCWRHCCERRTCWWKDGSEHAMVWCDERLPGAALPSPRPQTWSSQQVPPRHLRNTLIWWARSETMKKIGSEARIRIHFCVSWCCNVTYMQKVIQRSQPACPSLPWCSIFFYWSLHEQRLYKCESLFRVASCGQKKTVVDWWVPLGSIN